MFKTNTYLTPFHTAHSAGLSPKAHRPSYLFSILAAISFSHGSASGNLITNGSFEDTAYSGSSHTAPGSWTVGGPANRGGLHNNSSRASDGNQYVPMGGWTNEAGMQLSQTVNLSPGSAYQLKFDAGINHGSGEGDLLVEVFGGGSTPLSREASFQSSDGGMMEIQLQFVATSSQMTVRFTHTRSTGSTDLDLDHVRLQSAPLHLAQNGIVIIEAESETPVGDWRESPVDGSSGLLYDPPLSSLDAPPVGQTLSYIFRTNEAASYHFALKSSRLRGVIAEDPNTSHPDPWIKYGDTKNNDVWFSLYNARTGEQVQAPIRHFTANWNNSNGQLKWGNLFGNNQTSRLTLDANTDYRLELTGRGDGFVMDRIAIRSEAHKNNTSAFQTPGPGSEQTPKLPNPQSGSIDLTQHPDMERWSKAGVTGGIPQGLPVQKTIQAGADLQAAINEVQGLGGGVLLLQNGTYNVSEEILMKSNVVVRGEDREQTRIEHRYSGTSGKTLFVFPNSPTTSYSGLENLTMEYFAPDGSKPTLGNYGTPEGFQQNGKLVAVGASANNNWVKGCNVFNAGGDPISVGGYHNTFTDNYVDGAYNKNGGIGYYRVNGRDNLIKGEIVKAIRHFGILSRPNSKFNVVTDCFLDTDLNFHSGDEGHNLIEGNTISLPRWHTWGLIGTGGIMFDHIPPGNDNLLVNNMTYGAGNQTGGWSEQNKVYTFEGYGAPQATNIPIPQGGRFYVAENPQLTFANPSPANRTMLTEGSSIGVEVQANVAVSNMKLYRNGVLVRQENASPYEWGIGNQNDPLLKNLSEGVYTYTVVATFAGGGTLEESFKVSAVKDSHDLDQRILGSSSYAYSGTKAFGTTVGQINNGVWLKYDKLRISGANTFKVRAASDFRSGTIEIRTGSPTGTLLGTVAIPALGNWSDYQTFSTDITQITAPTDIYLFCKGGNGWTFNIQSFEFFTDSGALDTIVQAEDYDSESGVQVIGGNKVGNIQNNDWVRFNSLNIAGANSFSANLSSNTAGGTLELRTGSPTGTLLGSIVVGNTGGWNAFQRVSTGLSHVSGVTDIYLVFKGGNGYLFDVDSFQFSSTFIPPTSWTQLEFRHSGKCIDNKGGTANGVEYHQWTCDASSAANRNFLFEDRGSGFWGIRSQKSNRCLDVASGNTTQGGKLHQWDCNTSNINQSWQIIDQGGGWFSLKSERSGKCLEVSAASIENSARIQQWTCDSSDKQRLRFR